MMKATMKAIAGIFVVGLVFTAIWMSRRSTQILDQIRHQDSTNESAAEWTRTAWATCEDGDAMLILAGEVEQAPGSDARRPLVLAACECARLALPYVPKGETRPLTAIKMAERWARQEGATPDDVRRAADEAHEASAASRAEGYSARHIDSSAAEEATAEAAFAASDASAAAYEAANAVSSSSSEDSHAAAMWAALAAGDAKAYKAHATADAKAAYVAARKTVEAAVQRKCADIVRKYFPTPPAKVSR